MGTELTFKRSDAARLIRAAEDTGKKVRGITVDKDGVLTVLTEDAAAPAGDGRNDWDGVLPDAENKKRPA
jgi:hypothetical protein